MAGWDERGTGAMRGVLFSLLDPIVAGRPLGTVLEAGVCAVCNPRELEGRYGWKLCSLGPGCNLASLQFRDASFGAILALEGHRSALEIERAAEEMVRVLARGGLLVLGAPANGAVSRKSLIRLAERQSLRVLRASYVWPVDGRFPAALQATWLRAGLNLPVGRSVILIGEKPAAS